MTSIFILEDDEHIRELLEFNLKDAGYDVKGFGTGAKFWKALESYVPDLCVLDIMLPDTDGVAVCSKLRAGDKTSDIPIIMLTAKSSEIDKVVALEIGADDYVTKPFGMHEFISRVKALLRRASGRSVPQHEVLSYGPFRIDYPKRTVFKNGVQMDMNNKEFELFHLLLSNPGRVFSRNEILDKVWGYEYFGETRTVDVHVCHIRNKIEENPSKPKFINTIINVGYRFNQID